ncbi:hypothetical protein [Actinomadura litoris]|uniref:hypothetical protein n=1 Tax=Actinomadura litoris TaxID=2678616 RepID=UPI001FA729B8|nr:hypothetical protein [Actinomadura litoris]
MHPELLRALIGVLFVMALIGLPVHLIVRFSERAPDHLPQSLISLAAVLSTAPAMLDQLNTLLR